MRLFFLVRGVKAGCNCTPPISRGMQSSPCHVYVVSSQTCSVCGDNRGNTIPPAAPDTWAHKNNDNDISSDTINDNSIIHDIEHPVSCRCKPAHGISNNTQAEGLTQLHGTNIQRYAKLTMQCVRCFKSRHVAYVETTGVLSYPQLHQTLGPTRMTTMTSPVAPLTPMPLFTTSSIQCLTIVDRLVVSPTIARRLHPLVNHSTMPSLGGAADEPSHIAIKLREKHCHMPAATRHPSVVPTLTEYQGSNVTRSSRSLRTG